MLSTRTADVHSVARGTIEGAESRGAVSKSPGVTGKLASVGLPALLRVGPVGTSSPPARICAIPRTYLPTLPV